MTAASAGPKPVTWVQPEDLLRHELWQSARELGPDQQDALQRIADRWVGAGGTLLPPHVGASPELGDRGLRPLAEELLAAVAAIPSVRAAELRASALRAGISIARADYLPTLSAFIQSGFQAFPTDWSFPTSRGALVTVTCPEGSEAGRVCTQQNGGWFTVWLANETLSRTDLGERKVGEQVNLERAMGAEVRFGGHFVQVSGKGLRLN